jgi:hypothetical protein
MKPWTFFLLSAAMNLAQLEQQKFSRSGYGGARYIPKRTKLKRRLKTLRKGR